MDMTYVLFTLLLSCVAFIFGFKQGFNSSKKSILEFIKGIQVKRSYQTKSHTFEEGVMGCREFLLRSLSNDKPTKTKDS